MVVSIGVILCREGLRGGSSTMFGTEKPQVRSSLTGTVIDHINLRYTRYVEYMYMYTQLHSRCFAARVHDLGSD